MLVEEADSFSGVTAGLDYRGFLLVQTTMVCAPCISGGVREPKSTHSGENNAADLDVGNSNTVIALFRLESESASEVAAHWRITTHKTQTADEYGVLFLSLFDMQGIKASDSDRIIIASVVPPVESTLRRVCEKLFQAEADVC